MNIIQRSINANNTVLSLLYFVLLLIVISAIVYIKHKPITVPILNNTYAIAFTITLTDEDSDVSMAELYEFIGYYLEENAGIHVDNQLMELGMAEMQVDNFVITKCNGNTSSTY